MASASIVFAGMAGKLSKLAGGVLMTHYTRSKVPTGLLADITSAAGGTADLAATVAVANTARHALELWQAAGLVDTAAGTELCRRTADVISPGSAPGSRTGTLPRIEVIMVDFTGRNVIAALPRARRPGRQPHGRS